MALCLPLGHNVISIVNRLQDIFAQLDSSSTVELPQVAVVGSRSSGKSSVLEALVGRDFLPHGSDLCTRRPLVLQLLQTKRKPHGADEEYGEFSHAPGKWFYDFNDIRLEIQAETDKEAGKNKGVSDKQIHLKIFSPNVVDITLVDLPGITKVPVGDQPTDIESRIRTMIMSYIKLPSCLILAVTPAHSDLANSDALQIARIADPDGYRTIGVITKLDIMDRGTDARNFLLGKVIPLRLGFIGVVNRRQEDMMLNRTIKDALNSEEKFFQSHPVYNELADRCGVPQLTKKINQILVQHIKTVLPGLKSRISAALVSVAKEHASCGEITESKDGMGDLLLNILSKYSKAFSSMIEGKNEEMSTSEFSVGARIHYIFQSIFVKSLEEVDPCEDLTDDDIQTAIQNATGPRSALFVPEVAFEALIRRQIARLLDPSLQCARFIHDELIKMSHRCLINELQRFPVLRKRMDDAIGNLLGDGLQLSETVIGQIVEMEMDYINASHPNFIVASKAIETAMQQVKPSRIATTLSRQKDGLEPEKAPQSETGINSRAVLAQPLNGIVTEQRNQPGSRAVGKVEKSARGSTSWRISSNGFDSRTSVKENPTNKLFSESVQAMDRSFSMIHLRDPPTVLRPPDTHSDQESIDILVIKLLLRSYYDIVKKNIEDSVPKAIMHFLVSHTKRELHNVFIKKLYRDDLFEQMLQKPDEVATKRRSTRDMLCVLQQDLRILDELTLEAETLERGYSLTNNDTMGLPKIHGPADYTASPKNALDPLEAETVERGYSLTNNDTTGLPKIHGPADYTASPKNPLDPLEAETVERGYSLTNNDTTGLPKIHGPADYTASPKNPLDPLEAETLERGYSLTNNDTMGLPKIHGPAGYTASPKNPLDPLEAETVERGYSLTNNDTTGLPKINGPADYTASTKNPLDPLEAQTVTVERGYSLTNNDTTGLPILSHSGPADCTASPKNLLDPLEAETVEQGYSLTSNDTIHGLPTLSNSRPAAYTVSVNKERSQKISFRRAVVNLLCQCRS